jgi:hypothetical protein
LKRKEKGKREKAHSSPMSYLTNTKSQGPRPGERYKGGLMKK